MMNNYMEITVIEFCIWMLTPLAIGFAIGCTLMSYHASNIIKSNTSVDMSKKTNTTNDLKSSSLRPHANYLDCYGSIINSVSENRRPSWNVPIKILGGYQPSRECNNSSISGKGTPPKCP